MSKPNSEEILGLDIGGMIIDRGHGRNRNQQFYGDDFLETPEIDGAIESVAQLVKVWGGRVHLVSRANRRSQYRNMRWLVHHGFFRQTGLGPESVHFCRERAAKAAVCRRLGITCFVDDRMSVLKRLHDLPRRYYFHPGKSKTRRSKNPLTRKVVRVRTWRDLLARLT